MRQYTEVGSTADPGGHGNTQSLLAPCSPKLGAAPSSSLLALPPNREGHWDSRPTPRSVLLGPAWSRISAAVACYLVASLPPGRPPLVAKGTASEAATNYRLG